MSYADEIAPIDVYSRYTWLTGFLILMWIFTTVGTAMFSQEYWVITLLFFLAMGFMVTWWLKVERLERPSIQETVKRVGLGFLMGLGGLMAIFYTMNNAWKITTLWYIPAAPPAFALALGIGATTAAILTQLAVGIVEEGIFRVGLPRLLLDRGVNSLAVILFANFAFGLFHWSAYAGNTTGLMVAVFAGLIQSFAYFNSRSALGIMLGHSFWNIWAAGLLGGLLLYFALGLLMVGGYYLLKLKKINLGNFF